MLFTFAILPGMPGIPFFILGLVCAYIAYLLKKHAGDWATSDTVQKPKPGEKGYMGEEDGATGELASAFVKPGSMEDLQKMIQIEAFTVELGYGLLPMADKKQSGDMLDRITGVRQKAARELGILLPPISVKDNLELDANEYRFLLRNKEIARGGIMPNRWLAMNVGGSEVQLKGVTTVEPVFGLDAVWINDEERKNAEINGYTVVDCASVMITHLTEVIREHAYLLLEREDTQKLIDVVKEKNPTLISELLPEKVSVGLIQRVLQNLLQERISIKNLSLILETIGDFADVTKNPDDLSEQVRRKMGHFFISEYETEANLINAITLHPQLEQLLVSRVKRTQFEVSLMMDPALTRQMLNEMAPRLNEMVEQGFDPVIITTMELRLPFKRFFDPSFPRLIVLSYQELPNKTQVQNFGVVSLPISNEQQPQVTGLEEPQVATA